MSLRLSEGTPTATRTYLQELCKLQLPRPILVNLHVVVNESGAQLRVRHTSRQHKQCTPPSPQGCSSTTQTTSLPCAGPWAFTWHPKTFSSAPLGCIMVALAQCPAPALHCLTASLTHLLHQLLHLMPAHPDPQQLEGILT
jgi:hypothetical protein